MTQHLTEAQRAILRIVQTDLPDSATPYADIAAQVGVSEQAVLELLRHMKAEGSIRRFGASLKHQNAGYTHNAMVAWIADSTQVDELGAKAAQHPLISHCYYRPSNAPDWPYTLFTMIHGRHKEEYLQVIETLRRETALDEYAVLSSIKELKKTSMTYF